jgi:hypothetical protein
MRTDLINEYVQARMSFGDLDEDQEAMSPAELRRNLRSYAETLTDDQLVRACNSYALAD